MWTVDGWMDEKKLIPSGNGKGKKGIQRTGGGER